MSKTAKDAPTSNGNTSGIDLNTLQGVFSPNEHRGACPHCGYCPHCGRGGNRWDPYHSPWYPQYPYVTWC